MIKKLIALACIFAGAQAIFAYNPPLAGDRVYTLASPYSLSDGNSAAGGPILNIRPGSIVNNPAITALEQRITLDLGFSFIHDDRGDDQSGAAFETGILIPGKLGVASAMIEGVFTPMADLHLANSINGKLNVAKDLNEKLVIGLNFGGGALWGEGSDWSLTGDLGALYTVGKLGFLNDFRIGGSLLNLGKVYDSTDLYGVKDMYDPEEDNGKVSFPGMVTPSFGAAATLIQSYSFKCGLAANISAPFFQAVKFDAALQLLIMDIVKLNVAWGFNSLELAKDAELNLPAFSLGVKFNINSGKVVKSSDANWATSDLDISAAWQRMYKHVDIYSVGAVLNVGAEDNDPPEIIIW